MKRKNVRPLDTIAVDIHQLERGNIIDLGDLLLEAKSQCVHGDWLKWLTCEFDWSVDTAERYMGVAAWQCQIPQPAEFENPCDHPLCAGLPGAGRLAHNHRRAGQARKQDTVEFRAMPGA